MIHAKSIEHNINPSRVHDGKASWFYQVAPELTARSDWERHQVNVDIRSSYSAYPEVRLANRPYLEAKVDGLAVTGCDFLQFDDNGKIVDFMVMVRPLRAAEALAKEMGARFDSIVEMASRGN